ncbi:MAG: hypothetical protein QXS54_03360 [Candidatus Methanomethylicaceae archaeon]
MNLDFFVCAVILLGTFVVGEVTVLFLRGIWQRVLLIGMLAGLLIYSGIGAAYPEVPRHYLIYYFGFLLAFTLSFGFFCFIFAPLDRRLGPLLQRIFVNVESGRIWFLIIWVYILLNTAPLIYPEIKLGRLFAPPSPDLTTAWRIRWESQGVDAISKLLEYGRVLLTPFFYISLFRYRHRLTKLVFLLSLVLYFQYVTNGYIGRGAVLIELATVWISLWIDRTKDRRFLIAVALAGLPLILAGSYYYGVVRIGGAPEGVSFGEAIIRMIENEFSFVRNVGAPVINAELRVNLTSYAKWLFTLPLPKVLTGEIEGARINYEIAEFILGIPRGQSGWFVPLGGLVAESVYIFGRYFFWLHAIFIALLAAFLIRLMERTQQLLFLKGFVVVTFSYHLNRGGISGPMGVFVNHFLLFYLFIFAYISGLFKVGQITRQ